MNIYFLARWGNGEDDDGPDSSSETNVIVRAIDLKRASELADPLLQRLPVKAKNGRPVEMFTQVATLIGSTNIDGEGEAVVCYPWYGGSLPDNCAKVWKRDSLEQGWITFEEYHGESPFTK
jgi:hypothetical protein